MKNHSLNFLKSSVMILSTSLILFSCGSSSGEKSFSEHMATEQKNKTKKSGEPSQQPEFNGDSNRTFIRKANLAFKVKDVKTSTFEIESIVNANRGYVTTSNLESTINCKNSVRISKDSMLNVIDYTVHSNLIIRIPNGELHKTLTEIAVLIDYLEYRRINAEDVTAQFQDAKLTEKRYSEHKQRLKKAIDEKGKKLDPLVEAENNLLEKQQHVDRSKISSSELTYNVAYSTVAITIYQKETTKKEMYAYCLPTEPYKPNFGAQLMSSLNNGLVVFEQILLFFIKLWPIAILIIGCIYIFKSARKLKWFN